MAKTIMFSKDQIVGITELQRNASAVASKTKDRDIFILKNNVPHMVLVDFGRYERLMERAEQADIYEMLQERKKNPVWKSSDEAFEGLSLFTEESCNELPADTKESSRKGGTSQAKPEVAR